MAFLYVLFHINLFYFDNPTITKGHINTVQTDIIESYEEDVTGDGLKETIELKGILLTEENAYYRKLWVDIRSPYAKQWKISFGGGYEPTLQFIDLNHDGVLDFFFQSATGGSGGLYNYSSYTLKNEAVSKIPLPKDQYIKGHFKNNYIVEIQLSPNKEPLLFDASKRSETYNRLNIYDKKGRLLEARKKVMIDPIAYFEPKYLSNRKGYALKSYQQISGAYHADQLGTIETLWYFEKDDWIILKTEWNPVST
ncbi:hypothetical protein ACLIBH_03930 [Virgibacillus sp. W0430]|uniref:hypothetical protein n=1 Tax=Virgibacillus sp. W0430 TaxID=3391580 RepID=UPI003F47EF94